MIVGALVLPVVTVGITEASMTRKPADTADPEPRVDDRHRVLAHLAGADRVMEVDAAIVHKIGQFARPCDAPGPGMVSAALCRASGEAAKIRRAKSMPASSTLTSLSADR